MDKSWIFVMAWRDMRYAKRKLTLFALAVVSGVAALVAINSFRANLEGEMDRQSRSLLGADVEYDSRQPFDDEANNLIATVAAEETANEIHFSTMAYFATADDTRLVMTHAMEGGFPWYGNMDTLPEGLRVADSLEPVALLEDGLMLQFDLKVGDPIKLGEQTFTIIGELLRLPGEGSFSGSFAPRVLIPKRFFDATGLGQYGSRLHYFVYQKFGDESAVASDLTLAEVREQIESMEIDVDTVEDQRRQIGNALDGMNSFLSMVGFVALLLGGVAISGAVQVYLKGKADSVATLRCLGASARQAILIFCIQISLVGFIGSLGGAVLGIVIQSFLPILMESFLPIDLPVSISWPSVLGSLAFGWLFTSLFAFLPLLPLRRVSPLRAIRASVDEKVGGWKDRAFLLVTACLVGLTMAFTITQTQTLGQAAGFFGGIAVAISLLALIGKLFRMTLRKLSVNRLPYVWRQGLANLYRPNNRTTMLVVTLGMGAFLVYTVYISEQSLLRQADLTDSEGQPNVILFDIQPDQLKGVNDIIRSVGVEPSLAEPIVTMRLQSLNGKSAQSLVDDPSIEIENWAAQREYRSTYRDFIREDERIETGIFTAQSSFDSDTPVPISVESRIVNALKLKIGDIIVWDVQGFPIETEVTSIRSVDWRQMKPNFFVVFPTGVLEAAPAFFVTSTHAPSRTSLVKMQSAVVKSYPNVSAVNLTMILESLEEIFEKVSFVIRFMASFTIVTGLVALMSSVLTSRYQRIREGALLRTIGASTGQIRGIMAVEYLLVGGISAMSGIALSVAAGWAVSKWVLRVDLYVPVDVTLYAIAFITFLSFATGMLNSIGIATRSPMESIRNELA